MFELQIKTDEIEVLTTTPGVLEFTDASDPQYAAVTAIHRRLADEIAQQHDTEDLLKTMLADPGSETLTVELAHDDVTTYCNIANDLQEPSPAGQPRGAYDNEIFHQWRMVTDRWSRRARSQEA